MRMTVRQCMRCGRDDLRERWPSMDEAIEAGALSNPWTCPVCAWTEADLVEVTADADADNVMSESSSEDDTRREVDAGLRYRYPHA